MEVQTEKTATRNMTGQRISTRKMAVAGMLGAVSIVLSVTGLGMIPMPSLAGRGHYYACAGYFCLPFWKGQW